MSDKKSPVILVIVALLMFAGIYFIQTWLVRNELKNALKSKTDTIILELKSITNSSVTNTFTIDEASILKLESSIENILRLENGYTREYVNQIIKNSTDVTTFWLAFLSVFMVIFSLFSIYANNNILKKTEEEAKSIIEKLTKKSDDAMKKIQEIEANIQKIEASTKESKKEAKISEDKAKAESLFTQGLNAQIARKFDESINYYTEAIELNPDNSYAYNNKGNSYVELKDYNLAIVDYSKAIDLNSDNSYVYNNRGNAYRKQEKYDLAIADYSKAIGLNPKYSDAYNNRGNAYSKQEKYDLAMDDYTEAIRLNPNLSEVYCNRGIVYGKQGNYEGAMNDFNKAIDLNPNLSEVYNNRGYVYYKQENYKEAMNDFEKVPIDMIKSDEESVDAIKGMAKKGNERAIEFCKKNNIEY